MFPREEYLLTDLRFSTGYTATSYLGSDRPGGEGDGWIRSVVEVVMPTDEVEWSVALLIEQTSGFSGSTRIRLENVTDGITLFETNERVDSSFLLSDVRGDLMRVTFESEGRGSAPEGLPTMGFYRVIASSVFIIPEPTTVVLLAISIPVVCCRRVRKSRAR